MRFARMASRLQRCVHADAPRRPARARLALRWRMQRAIVQSSLALVRPGAPINLHTNVLQLFHLPAEAPVHTLGAAPGMTPALAPLIRHQTRIRSAWAIRPATPTAAPAVLSDAMPPQPGRAPLRPLMPMPAGRTSGVAPVTQRRLRSSEPGAAPASSPSGAVWGDSTVLPPPAPAGILRAVVQPMSARGDRVPAQGRMTTVPRVERVRHVWPAWPQSALLRPDAASAGRATFTIAPAGARPTRLLPPNGAVHSGTGTSTHLPTTQAAAPLALRWRPPSPLPVLSDVPPTSPIRPGAQVAAAQAVPQAEASERIVAEARAAVRHEMHSTPNLERLAADVMARIDKRMRIARERRGR